MTRRPPLRLQRWTPKRRTAHQPDLVTLERRTLLADSRSTFARLDGELEGGEVAMVEVRIGGPEFMLPRGRVLIGIKAEGVDGGPPPKIARVERGEGALVPRIRTDGSGAVTASLGRGTYSVIVAPGSGARQAFRVNATLLGDTDGDGRVGRDDLRRIRSLFGARKGGDDYQIDADVNSDGRIGPRDRILAARNLRVSTRVRPLALTAGLDPTSDPDGDGTVNRPDVVIAGQTAPNAVVRLDRGANGSFERVARADRDGLYRFVATVGLGKTRFRVVAADAFGQRRTVGLSVTRRGGGTQPPVVDRQAPTLTLRGPASGLVTRTNVSIAGRVADNLSGVASLTAQVDDAAPVPVAFDAAGNFTFTTSLALDGSADRAHAVRLRASDRAGNGPVDAVVAFTLDTRPPTAIGPAGTFTTAPATLRVAFSEKVAGATSLASYTLRSGGGTVAIGSITQIDATTFDLNLAGPLADGAYELVIGPGVTDPVGNPLAGTTTFTFMVVRPAAIASISPANGEEMVSLTHETTVRFDEKVNPATITADSLYLIAKGQRVPGTIRVSPTEKFAFVFYDAPLPESTEVRVVVDGDQIIGRDGLAVDADGDGRPGGMATADFSTLPLTFIPGTRVFGYVYDSYNKNPDGTDIPVVGARISLDADPGVFAVTDTTGFFELGLQDRNDDGQGDGLPAPEFFVHIDGGAATNAPAGTAYATLGKPFHSVPGQRVQLEMAGAPNDADPATPGEQFNIYLPPMAMSDIVSLDPAADTMVGFGKAGKAQLAAILPGVDPAVFDLLQVNYPAGSAQDQTGRAATRATVIPVAPDRLPAPLPPGVDPKLVISVQAGNDAGFNLAGGPSNFLIPAPVTFPNLEGLRPGEKSLIWSFDHDAGMWTIIGTGTVTVDGSVIHTDPGVGILAPGWHFTEPGTEPKPPKKPDKPPDCVPLNTKDVLEDVWSLGKSVFDCIRNMTKALQVIGTILDQVDAIKSIVQSSIKLGEDIKAGKNLSAAADALAIIEAQKDKAVSLYEAGTGLNPVTKAVEAAKCGVNLANTIASRFCTDERKKCYGSAGNFLCDNVTPLLEFANKLVSKASDLEKSIRDAPLTALCLSLNEVKNLLNVAGAGGDSTGPKRFAVSAAADPRGAIVAKFAEIGEIGGRFQNAFIPSLDSRETLREGMALTESIRAEGLTPLALDNRAYVGAYWKLTVGGAVNNGRTSASGEFDLPVIAPETPYKLEIYDFSRNIVAVASGVSARSGSDTIVRPAVVTELTEAVDTDGDGLADVAEDIIGTVSSRPDSDGDGVTDRAELVQGLNPLDNRGFPTGVISSLRMPGSAEDIAVDGDTVFVATGSHGLAIIDGGRFNNPILTGQIDLPGTATGVGVAPTLNIAAVAAGSTLELVDISDTMTPKVVRSVPVGAANVEVAGGFAYAVSGASLSVVDLLDGEVVRRVTLPGSGGVTGFVREGTHLYAYISGSDTLAVVDIANPEAAAVVGQVGVSIASSDVGLFVGNGVAWLAGSGLRTVDVSDPTKPALIHEADTFFTARGIALNGSGLGLLTPDGGSFVQVYDVSSTMDTNNFITQFNLSGSARSAAISRGIGYIGTSGRLEVVNYRPFDNLGVPPTARLSTTVADLDPTAEGVQVLEGTAIPLRVAIGDDVQVRSVEFLVDGVVAATDVAYPFDVFALAPNIAPGRDSVGLQVRATDTGGNITLSNVLTLKLVPDTFAPTVENISPADGSIRFEGSRTIRIRFSEALDPAGVTSATVTLVEAGPNGTFGDADDVAVPATVQLRDGDQLVQLVAVAPLPIGKYQVRIAEASITDRHGNALGAGVRTSGFTLRERPTIDNLFDLHGPVVVGKLVLQSPELKVGINNDGSFITDDRDVGIEFAGVEFVEPGAPLAGFTIARDGQNFTNQRPAGEAAQITVTRQDISDGPLHGVRVEGVVGGNLRLERVVLFNDGDESITIATRLTNLSDVTLRGVAWLENMDPDQGASIGTGSDSSNDVTLGGRYVSGSATNANFPAGLSLGLGSEDPRAVVSAEGFNVRDPFSIIDSPSDPDGESDDLAINLAFDFGDLAAGQTVSGALILTVGRSKEAAEANYLKAAPITAGPAPRVAGVAALMLAAHDAALESLGGGETSSVNS